MSDFAKRFSSNKDQAQSGAGSFANKHSSNNNANVDQDSQSSFANRYKKQDNQMSASSLDNNNQNENPNSNKINQIDPQKRMQAELIYLVKGVDAGRNAWYYVLVDRLKVQLFLKALNDEIIHLEEYGNILFSAYGDEPPSAVTQKLKDEYGIA